jgi:hypothetical protein
MVDEDAAPLVERKPEVREHGVGDHTSRPNERIGIQAPAPTYPVDVNFGEPALTSHR